MITRVYAPRERGLRWSFWERHAPASYGPLLAATVVASGEELALSLWMYRLTSAFPSTAAAAARAWLVVEGAVEAFGNVYVGMDVGAAVRLYIVRRQNEVLARGRFSAIASQPLRGAAIRVAGATAYCKMKPAWDEGQASTLAPEPAPTESARRNPEPPYVRPLLRSSLVISQYCYTRHPLERRRDALATA
jgi:hypothetical protein